MRTYREGFTLVEMLVTIVAASLVTLVTMTIMLTGIRLESKASVDAVGQNNTRLFASVLDDVEGIAFKGEFSEELTPEEPNWILFKDDIYPPLPDPDEDNSGDADSSTEADNQPAPDFALVSANCTPLLIYYYDDEKDAGQFTLSTGTVLLDDVTECTVEKNDSLLQIEATTAAGNTYNFAVNCHVIPQQPVTE